MKEWRAWVKGVQTVLSFAFSFALFYWWNGREEIRELHYDCIVVCGLPQKTLDWDRIDHCF